MDPRGIFWRLLVVVVVLLCILSLYVTRLLMLATVDRHFLIRQSDARASRIVDLPVYRGMIVDRHGKPLAVTTPIMSVWVNPMHFSVQGVQCKNLAKVLDKSCHDLLIHIKDNNRRSFLYLKRHISPDKVEFIRALNLEGINFKTEYKRYYPDRESTAQLLGFTNVDDKGQEGLELAYNQWLSGVSGSIRVIKDRLGRVVANKKVIALPKYGHTLTLSLDHRLQYLAYKALARGVQSSGAKAGSAIVLDVGTGEVLAMVNYPSFNPNVPRSIYGEFYRNRAVTDVMEPGSTMKAFSMANILQSGRYTSDSVVDVGTGRMKIDGKLVQDAGGKKGEISLNQVMRQSSNVGIAKLTLSLPPQSLPDTLKRFGFGVSTYSGFPGEVSGSVVTGISQRKFDMATLSFGYSLAVTPLQLARGFMILANEGNDRAISFLKVSKPKLLNRVIDAHISHQILMMLGHVAEKGGTGHAAQIPGIKVAGKTGTVHKTLHNGYAKDKYIASFAGVAPLEKPKRVVVVVIDEPNVKNHFGGRIAAPVFAKIMSGALMHGTT